MSDNRPTHTVKLSHKRRNSDKWFSSRVGVAWQRGERIDVAIDPGVAISTPEGVRLTLWPYEERQQGGGQRQQSSGGSAPADDFPADDFGDDDIPF